MQMVDMNVNGKKYMYTVRGILGCGVYLFCKYHYKYLCNIFSGFMMYRSLDTIFNRCCPGE